MTEALMPGCTITVDRVRDLLLAQFPSLADAPLTSLPSAGTDNQIFMLGEHLCVRLPKVDWAAETAKRETDLLPKFRGLELDVPKVVALGEAGSGYPWRWSILEWIEGGTFLSTPPDNMRVAAGQLARFIRSIREIPIEQGFEAGGDNHYRGVPLRERDAAMKSALCQLEGDIDTMAVARIWDMCLEAAPEDRSVWLHGDLHAGNLLVRDGRLAGVIDFGLMGTGDGACDLQPAWCLFDPHARTAFREAMEADENAWRRGAGWALSVACIALSYYRSKGNPLEPMSRRTIARILEAYG